MALNLYLEFIATYNLLHVSNTNDLSRGTLLLKNRI